MDLTKAPSESSKLEVSYDLQQSIFGDLHAEMDAQFSSSTPGSGASDRSKYAFFALQRAIERLRSFYYVLLVAFGCLISGVFLLVLTEILWLATRFTTGPVAEAVISGFSALGWLLVSATVAIASTCPVDELDFNAFVTPRPVLCIFLATLPLITSVTRVLDLPIPRWISCAVSLLMFVYACLYSQCCGTNLAAVPPIFRRFDGSVVLGCDCWFYRERSRPGRGHNLDRCVVGSPCKQCCCFAVLAMVEGVWLNCPIQLLKPYGFVLAKLLLLLPCH